MVKQRWAQAYVWGLIIVLATLPRPVRAFPDGGSATLLVLTVAHGDTRVLAIRGGTVRVLLHDRRVPNGTLTPSPDGRRVAVSGCCRIWVFNRDGTHAHRVVEVPRSPCRNHLSIGSVSWAPGGRRFAFSAFIASDAYFGCPPGVRDVMGAWVTPYDHPHLRRLTYERTPETLSPISWSPDGRTLAVSRPGGVTAVDVATGASHMLIAGGRQGVFAPVTGSLAYITGGFSAGRPTTIWAAGALGRHRHVLASTPLQLAPFVENALSWSPDGRSIAYITDSGTFPRTGTRTLWIAGAVSHRPRALVVNPISTAWSPDSRSIAYIAGNPAGADVLGSVDVATGRTSVLPQPGGAGARLLRGSQLSDVAWFPAGHR